MFTAPIIVLTVLGDLINQLITLILIRLIRLTGKFPCLGAIDGAVKYITYVSVNFTGQNILPCGASTRC